MTMLSTSAILDLKQAPDPLSETISQVLYGELLEVLEHRGQWQRVRNRRDGYEGFVDGASLAPSADTATHQVAVRSTLLFSEPDIKSPVVSNLMFSSELVLQAVTHDRFAATNTGQFVWSAHCQPTDSVVFHTLVAAAGALFAGTPYLWGGRSPAGCDCSALVQLAAFACGISLPRDSGDQEAALSVVVALGDRRMNDLVFWPGHVAIMCDLQTVLHATAHSLQCCREPLADVIDRAGPPSSVRRPGS